MNEILDIKAIIPYIPNFVTDDYPANQSKLAIGEIKEICNSEHFDISYLKKVNISFVEHNNEIPFKYKFLLGICDHHFDSYFELSFQANLNDNECIVKFGEDERIDVDAAKYFIADDFVHNIYKLFLIANIDLVVFVF